MYKSRFDKWGFTKNNSKKDVMAMLQVQRQRDAMGKRTAFHRNGKEVAIDVYLKRKGISQAELVEAGMAETLPQNLRCLTPPPEPPKNLQAPGHLSIQELVLHCIRDVAWNWYCPPDTPVTACVAHYRGDEVRCAITDLTNADWLFSVGQYEKGGNMCEEGFKSLHMLIKKPSIYGLIHLFQSVLDASNRGIVKEIWRYLAAYATTIKHKGPMTRLFQGIWAYFNAHDYDEYWSFLFDCTERLFVIGEQQLGLPLNTLARISPLLFIPRAYQYRTEPVRRLQSRFNYDKLVQDALPIAVEEQVVFIAIELSVIGTQTDWRSERVLELANVILDVCRGVTYNVELFYYIALTALAQYHRGQYKLDGNRESHELSVQALEHFVDIIAGRWDPDVGYMVGELERLEHWYREAGDDALADAMHERWVESLDLIPKDFVRGKKGILH